METRYEIPDASGLSLAAILTAPADRDSYPLVLLLHGFTGWKEEQHLATLAEELCSQGIAALRFDAMGSGDSGGTFAMNYRLTNYLTNVSTVLKFAETELSVDPNRIGIWGHSMGGFVALASAVEHDGALRAVCGSQPSMGKANLSPEEVDDWRAKGWKTFSNSRYPKIELPYSFYVDRQQYDALEIVGKLCAPLLLISGTDDDLVPAANVRAIHAAAPEPKSYKEFAAGHDYKNDAEQLRAINAVTVEFFRDALLP